MSNLEENDYELLRGDKEFEQTLNFYKVQQEWENNPMRILLEKQIEEIQQEIDTLIKWYKK